MPEQIRCSICGKAIKIEDFKDGMRKLRHHRATRHPYAFKKSIQKGIATREARS